MEVKKEYFLKATLVILLNVGLLLPIKGQSTEIRYDYDSNGNRVERNTVFLRVAQGGGNTMAETPFTEAAVLQESEGVADELTGELTLTLFPNPVQDEVRLEWSQPDVWIEEVRVFSNDGKEVYKAGKQEGNFSIPFNTVQPGYYVIWLKTDTGIQRYPLIKK